MSVVGNRLRAIAAPDKLERLQHPAGVIPMAMGKDDRLDRAEIDTQPSHVALESIFLGPGIEQDRALRAADGGGDAIGKSVTGAANRATRKFAKTMRAEIGEFGLNVGAETRKTVGRVVDQDMHGKSVDFDKVAHFVRLAKGEKRHDCRRRGKTRGVAVRYSGKCLVSQLPTMLATCRLLSASMK